MRKVETLWKESQVNEDAAKALAQTAGLSLPMAKTLMARNITSPDEAIAFMNPHLFSGHSPLDLHQGKEAAHRIHQAVENGEHILVYGDYDVDGITSSVVMTKFLKANGGIVSNFIPSRYEDGYGLSLDTIRKLPKNINLLITVDCGISSLEETKALIEMGIEVIITDHHEPKEELPAAYAVVNPLLGDYPFQKLAGVGVAYKLCEALCELYEYHMPKECQVFAAIGTIADLMPLVDENRSLVKRGLDQIKDKHNLGLEALLEVSGLLEKPVSAGHVGFTLGPKINAAGRIETAKAALDLFLTKDPKEAQEIATRLHELNEERKINEKEIVEQAKVMITGKEEFILVHQEDWLDGVIGIAASRIAEAYQRPTLVLTGQGKEVKGSGRSVGSFHLLDSLLAHEDYFTRFGGHKQAAGLSMEASKIEGLRHALNEYAKDHLTAEDRLKTYEYVHELDPGDLHHKLFDELDGLEPYGLGNPKPLFKIKGALVHDLMAFGKDKNHMKLVIDLSGRTFDAIMFFAEESLTTIKDKDRLDLLVTLEKQIFKGVEQLRLHIKDLKKVEYHQKAALSYEEYEDHLIRSIRSYPGKDRLASVLYSSYQSLIHEGKTRLTTMKFNERREGITYFPTAFPKLANIKELSYQEGRSSLEREIINQLPGREDLVKLFQVIGGKGTFRIDLNSFTLKIGFKRVKLKMSLAILKELSLFDYKIKQEFLYIKELPREKGMKLTLEASPLYISCQKMKEEWHELKRKN